MSRIASLLLPACVASMAAQACVPSLAGGRVIDSPRYTLAWRTDPARVAVGQSFSVDLVACPKDPDGRIDELRVDARMPEHRHGMNYQASVKPMAQAGRYRAEGLMFHMPGRWELMFDLRDANGIAHLTQEFALQ